MSRYYFNENPQVTYWRSKFEKVVSDWDDMVDKYNSMVDTWNNMNVILKTL